MKAVRTATAAKVAATAARVAQVRTTEVKVTDTGERREEQTDQLHLATRLAALLVRFAGGEDDHDGEGPSGGAVAKVMVVAGTRERKAIVMLM